MGGRDARKAEKLRAAQAAKKAQADAAAAAAAAAAAEAQAAEEGVAREDFMARLKAAEKRDTSKHTEKFWKQYFSELFHNMDEDGSRELDFEEAEAALGTLGSGAREIEPNPSKAPLVGAPTMADAVCSRPCITRQNLRGRAQVCLRGGRP